jgi:hypothetical protein
MLNEMLQQLGVEDKKEGGRGKGNPVVVVEDDKESIQN